MRSFRTLKLLSALLLTTLCWGCGTERYEQRLVETRKVIEYQNKLDANLTRPWSDLGVQIRMPKQFTLLPAPTVETDEQGQPIEAGPDPRQPSYMTNELPGLLAAFQGTVSADVSGEFKPVPAYAYVLGNHPFWLKSEVEQATTLHAMSLQALVDGLGLPQPLETEWKRESYPRTKSYVPPKEAQVWQPKTSRFVDETPAQVSMHLFKNQDILITVLFVYPTTIDPNEMITDRIEMALETLTFSGEKPVNTVGPAGKPAENTGF